MLDVTTEIARHALTLAALLRPRTNCHWVSRRTRALSFFIKFTIFDAHASILKPSAPIAVHRHDSCHLPLFFFVEEEKVA